MMTHPAKARRTPATLRWRRYHRWTSTGSMALLVWVSATGLALGIDVWTSGRSHPEPASSSGPLPRARAPEWVGRATARLAEDPAANGLTGARLVLRMTDEGPRLHAVITGAPQTERHEFEFGADSGALLSQRAILAERAVPKWRSALHRLLEDLHRGTIIGLPGQMLSLLAGLAFVFLTASGAWMYLDMWKKRRSSGKPAFFWSR